MSWPLVIDHMRRHDSIQPAKFRSLRFSSLHQRRLVGCGDDGPPLLVSRQRDEILQGLEPASAPTNVLRPLSMQALPADHIRNDDQEERDVPLLSDDPALSSCKQADAVRDQAQGTLLWQEASSQPSTVMRELPAVEVRKRLEHLCGRACPVRPPRGTSAQYAGRSARSIGEARSECALAPATASAQYLPVLCVGLDARLGTWSAHVVEVAYSEGHNQVVTCVAARNAGLSPRPPPYVRRHVGVHAGKRGV